ncbi:hypothetical protein K469DRAFT_672389 [Zopfia rhizophila CBS 207.26]|uniref:Uncharacterized protein n=1 Tax=Zopfia rhizophila CBS 207.26 TaxID=1314779 RepID=A0A6A6DS64_9PEZI|nr:hypothetical protein K469DRAFT_672389 [Zopfia rhizophila CBS 207.26]
MQYFAAHLHPGQQTTHSLRASQYKTTKKRKRDEDSDEGAEEPPVSPEHNVKGQPSSNTQSHSSFAPIETEQLRVAGLLPEDVFDVPPPPFPHTHARALKDKFNYTNLQRELAALDPPLYAVNAASKSHPIDRKSEQPALRQTHLDILTTILHHCLLEGDYHRAGRAWGMILRTQVAGKAIDLRNHGRWGIGAELLLHRNARKQSSNSQSTQQSSQNSGNDRRSNHEQSLFTDEEFKLARDYYERLIIQYPNRKQVPHAIDELTFYPAMFSLWIYNVCEESKQVRRCHKEEMRGSKLESTRSEDTTMASSADALGNETVIRYEELRQARKIAGRLDQLIISPPFDKHTGLLQLRGMVGLWLGDLILGPESAKHEQVGWGSSSREHNDSSGETTLEKLKRYSESRTEIQQAREFFERAQGNGGRVWKGVENVEPKIEDLTKKMEKMQ